MIELKNVTKKYLNTTAVDDLSLTVGEGEIFGLLGPNGAGKTTTLKMLAALLVPTSGSITVGGFNLATDSIKAKQITSYLPDKPFIYERLTGFEFLEFVLELYGKKGLIESSKNQDRLCELFGLKNKLNELVESYSHGMRQKIAITAALITNPKLLIIDEPMVGLDLKGAKQTEELFKELANNNSSVLLSTHTISIAQKICHRIGIIHNGKLLAVGSMEQLRKLASSDDSDLESIFLSLTEISAEEAISPDCYS
ncbi:MAG: ABC transporter ATP-binding protein [Nitrospinota bacterium]